MLHLSVHVCPFTNAKLESYLLEVLAGEHTQVDYGLTYLKIFPLIAITRQCWTRVNPLMLIHGGLGSNLLEVLSQVNSRSQEGGSSILTNLAIYLQLISPRQRNEYEWK